MICMNGMLCRINMWADSMICMQDMQGMLCMMSMWTDGVMWTWTHHILVSEAHGR